MGEGGYGWWCRPPRLPVPCRPPAQGRLLVLRDHSCVHSGTLKGKELRFGDSRAPCLVNSILTLRKSVSDGHLVCSETNRPREIMLLARCSRARRRQSCGASPGSTATLSPPVPRPPGAAGGSICMEGAHGDPANTLGPQGHVATVASPRLTGSQMS